MISLLIRTLRHTLYVALAIGVCLFSLYFFVEIRASKYCTSVADELPRNAVAVVLGTSERVVGGADNLYFLYRMEAVAALYHSGIVQKIVVSGDNSTPYYDEPSAMLKALRRLDVPEEVIIKDGGGVRTFASVLRCREELGLDTAIFISQNFHVRRAVYIARSLGMNAAGYIADDVSFFRGLPILTRELFARVIAVWEVNTYSPTPILELEENHDAL